MFLCVGKFLHFNDESVIKCLKFLWMTKPIALIVAASFFVIAIAEWFY